MDGTDSGGSRYGESVSSSEQVHEPRGWFVAMTFKGQLHIEAAEVVEALAAGIACGGASPQADAL